MHSGNLEWSEGMVLGEYSFILSHCMLLFFSHSVISNSLRPHRLHHARLPCCSLSPQSLLKLLSIESMMPSNHLILCRPLLLLPSIFPNIRVFSNELALCIRWPKYWSFSISISPSNEYSGLISFKISLVGRKMFSASSSSQEETWWSYLLGRGALKVMFTFINLLLFCVGSKKLENFFEVF